MWALKKKEKKWFPWQDFHFLSIMSCLKLWGFLDPQIKDTDFIQAWTLFFFFFSRFEHWINTSKPPVVSSHTYFRFPSRTLSKVFLADLYLIYSSNDSFNASSLPLLLCRGRTHHSSILFHQPLNNQSHEVWTKGAQVTSAKNKIEEGTFY